MAKLFEGARQNKKFVAKFILFALIFWLLQFSFQYYFAVPNEPESSLFKGAGNLLQTSLVRSLAFSGATFFAIALLLSSFFRWKPNYAKYWHVRRSFGVMGFVFIFFHFQSVLNFYFLGNLFALLPSINPFLNPIVFGLLAFPIFFLMFLTSTDWAFDKLGAKKWKTLHRLVYFGFMFGVFHFLLINPPILMSFPGYLLILITFSALAGELYWFIQTVLTKKSSTLATIIGILIILLYLLLGYFAFIA